VPYDRRLIIGRRKGVYSLEEGTLRPHRIGARWTRIRGALFDRERRLVWLVWRGGL